MPQTLGRTELESRSLAELHSLATEQGLAGFRRLRKSELIDALVGKDGEGSAAKPETPRPRRPRRSRASREGSRSTEAPSAGTASHLKSDSDRDRITGRVELQKNGSALVTSEGTDASIYVSPAQVKRCSLSTGDVVSGPIRSPRRSERYSALVRVEEINGRPASEVTESGDSKSAPQFPSETFELSEKDDTVKTVMRLTPFGKGSRVVITGAAHAGKTEMIRRLANAFSALSSIELSIVLCAARPEEIAEFGEGPLKAKASHDLAASPDAQRRACEQAVDAAQRAARRGVDAVVLIDSLTDIPEAAKIRLMSKAGAYSGGGSLTIIATGPTSVGGETTIIALDAILAGLGRFPAIDFNASSTLRPELLVGDKGVKALTKAKAEALLS